MDAIGMSVGLAGASFGSNEGYTILAGEFVSSTERPGSSDGNLTVLIKEFANPVNGIMGWFGAEGRNGFPNGALSGASSIFVNNVAKNPLFITPSTHYSSSNWGEEARITTTHCTVFLHQELQPQSPFLYTALHTLMQLFAASSTSSSN